MEVIVVDSSVRPSLSELDLRNFQNQSPLTLVYLRSRSYGVNTKRNLGLTWASSPITLFLDDDCELESTDLIDQHINFHANNPEYILGGAYQNRPHGLFSKNYDQIHFSWRSLSKRSSLPPYVGGHLSLKTGHNSPWLRFDEDFKFGGTEKELILRSIQQGLSMRYLEDLKVPHHIQMTALSFLRKAFFQGRGEAILRKRYPQLFMSTVDDTLRPRNFGSMVYDIFFQTGMIYGFRYSLEPVRATQFLKIFFQKFFWVSHFDEKNKESNLGYLKEPYFPALQRLSGVYWLIYPVLKKVQQAIEEIYWIAYPIFRKIQGNLWRVPVNYHRAIHLYYRCLAPVIIKLMKPYFFLRYQVEKRVLGLGAVSKERHLD